MTDTSPTPVDDDRVTPPAAALPPVEFLRIDHVGVAVPDLDEALTFYADHFGLREDIEFSTGVERAVRTDDGGELTLSTGEAPEPVKK